MKRFFLAIDLGGTLVKIGIVIDGKVIAKKIFAAHASIGLEDHLPYLQNEMENLILENHLERDSLRGVGMAFPGIVDATSKKILSTNKKYDDAPSIDLAKWVKNNWQVPFNIDNDARMATVGEWKFGAGQDTNNLVVMTIGTGIGTSVVMEGKLLRGKHSRAGCLGGHFTIKYNGRVCSCGNQGCVEAYGSTWSLAETITKHESFNTSVLAALHSFDFSNLFDAAARHDKLAITVLKDCMDVWSTGIVNLIHAYDPEVVVLGGGVMKSAELILPYVKERVEKLAWCHGGGVDIRPSLLAEDAIILGVDHCSENNI